MALTAPEVFRDYATDGVPSSGPHEPKKSEIRTLLGQYEQIINAFTSNGGLVYSTKAAMDADIAREPNSMAWVVGDPVAENNGIYRKNGSAGFGFWFRVADLPYSFIVASDVGNGTPDAIVATSSLPISGSALVLLNIFEANTGSPVTVSFNGGTPLTIKTNSGNDIAPGGLTAGMTALGRVSGSTFRLVSDQASAAILAAAEAAANRAEAAEDSVLGLLGGVTPVFPTKALAQAYAPDVAPGFMQLAGYHTAGDGGAARYMNVASEPSHAGKYSITLSDGVTVEWYEIAEPAINVKMFGAKGDGAWDDRPACQDAVDYVVGLGGGKVLFPNGTYRLVGAPSPDSKLNGLVIPFISFTVDNRVVLEGSGQPILKAASNDMIILRRSQPGSVTEGIQFDGGRNYEDLPSGLTGVWGVCDIPADMTQTTTLVSQSYMKLIDCYIQRCEEGYILAPGPNVGGFGSGCYYPVLMNCDFNLNARAMWFRAGFVPDPTNRPTRGNLLNCRIERGNTGIDFAQVTEFNVFGCFMQYLRASPYGAAPYANGAGMRFGPLTENVTVYGSETEAADYDYFLDPACLPNAVRIPLGSNLGGVSSNLNFSPIQAETFYRLTRRGAAYEQLHVTAHHSAFARLVFDYSASNTKDANIDVNGVRRQSWGAANNLHMNTTHQFFLADGVTPTGVITSNRIAPGADNVQSAGQSNQRFTQLFAATSTIGTSDAREKDWRGGLNEAELRVAARLSKIIGVYRWKEAVEKKGNGARLHAGVTVQAVMQLFKDEGLDPFAYAMVCYDEWEDEFVPDEEDFDIEHEKTGEIFKGRRPKLDADGNPVMRQTVVGGNRYGLRYDEMWAFVAAGFEARLALLEMGI